MNKLNKTQHQIDCDTLMENIAELLRKIAKFSLNNRAKFEALVMENLALQQTDEMKKQRKRIPQVRQRVLIMYSNQSDSVILQPSSPVAIT